MVLLNAWLVCDQHGVRATKLLDAGNDDGVAFLYAAQNFDGTEAAAANGNTATLRNTVVAQNVGDSPCPGFEKLPTLQCEYGGSFVKQYACRQSLVLTNIARHLIEEAYPAADLILWAVPLITRFPVAERQSPVGGRFLPR